MRAHTQLVRIERTPLGSVPFQKAYPLAAPLAGQGKITEQSWPGVFRNFFYLLNHCGKLRQNRMLG